MIDCNHIILRLRAETDLPDDAVQLAGVVPDNDNRIHVHVSWGQEESLSESDGGNAVTRLSLARIIIQIVCPQDAVAAARSAIRQALEGWQPPHAFTELAFEEGELEDIDNGIFIWNDIYNARLRWQRNHTQPSTNA